MSPINTPPTAPVITHHQTAFDTPGSDWIKNHAKITKITGANSVPDLRALAGALADWSLTITIPRIEATNPEDASKSGSFIISTALASPLSTNV